MTHAERLTTKVASEIVAAFKQNDEPKWHTAKGVERATQVVIESPSLTGQSVAELNRAFHGSFEHLVSFGNEPSLRKGFGIIADLLEDEGVYTGSVNAHFASDNYEL